MAKKPPSLEALFRAELREIGQALIDTYVCERE